MSPESSPRDRKASGFWLWVGAGLIGPALGFVSAASAPNMESPLALVVLALWPTWLFGWMVMGMKSQSAAYAILALTVVGNMLAFTGVGLVFARLTRRGWPVRWGAAVLAYAAVYAVITLIAYYSAG